jgi:hypothetical protein
MRPAIRVSAVLLTLSLPLPASTQTPDYCGERSARVGARTAAAATFAAANTGMWIYFKRAWWSGERAEHFHFKADWDENFRDQDKLGHFLGGYHLARLGDALLGVGCVSEPNALRIAATYATLFQLQIEVWDGFYEKYGFSYPDLLANTSGTLLAVLHERHPATRAVKPTVSYSPSAAMRARRRQEIEGELRYSLDYSGQTYWLSASIEQLLPETARRFWPGLLRLSLGHTITDWVSPTTGDVFRARRKLLLSLDLDPEALPGDAPLWRAIKRQLSYYRFPAPAIQLAPGLRGIAWVR